MFTLSPFNIVNHLKSDQRTYIEYLDMSSKIKKLQLQSVRSLILYNFGIKFYLDPALSYEKSYDFFLAKQHITVSIDILAETDGG